ncbi:GNAT family N-acetyltransferase [Streptomyces sp. A7024]|uniref:GNAT family N-acetyltransferase n=1 Tax=Streptomyces coryli TaxID=1128680 RepID=A0A6G4U9P1_9ACTN|nr:GNAT family N-acetyltransferase [Streptomyces coryli]NGN68406.1 GNAT family N-acetyltransferase [Streptomyces coryli]
MSLQIRDFRPEDAAAVAEVRRAAVPMVITAEGIMWRWRSAPEAMRLRLLVAELDGQVVGEVPAMLAHESSTPGQGMAHTHVHPDFRRRGAGSALLAEAEKHLAAVGATTVFAYTDDEPGALAFAERHGYRRTRRSHFLGLDLTTAELPPLADPPPGITLHPASALAADPRTLYEADAETTQDEPADITVDRMGYDDWLQTTWRGPELDKDLTTVVMSGTEVVAFTLAYTDGRGRYMSGGTGCRRTHRGRGLAKLVKNASLHRARETGITKALTGNDETNSPMLAINTWLGYHPTSAEWTCVRELS